MMDIRFFARDRAAYPFLSNFFPARISYGGTVWPTAEHLYQALKTQDPDERLRVRVAPTPAAAKRLGRTLTLGPDWDSLKAQVMRLVVREKFRQNPKLAARLMATGDAVLIEDSPFDRYWGAGHDGAGLNMLGKILMATREELRSSDLVPAGGRAYLEHLVTRIGAAKAAAE